MRILLPMQLKYMAFPILFVSFIFLLYGFYRGADADPFMFSLVSMVILTSNKDAAILEAIVTLGESLNMHLVIEGVEQRNQVDYLIGLSDNLLIQGYYYAKPMKPHELQEWSSQLDGTCGASKPELLEIL